MAKACLNRTGREGEGASCGDTETKGTPKPLQPPPTWFTKYWCRQPRVTVTSTRDFNKGLAVAVGLGEPVLLAECYLRSKPWGS